MSGDPLATADVPTPSTQEGPKLVGTGNAGNSSQGTSVAVSANGSTAVVGGSNDNTGTGSLWVFTRSGGKWGQQGSKLQGSDCVGASGLGTSVAISADGNTIVSGGSGDNGILGAAWIFTRTGGVWSQQGGKLVGNDYSPNGYPMQGAAVAISGDGNTAVVGGNGDNLGTGATWVYTRSGGVWTQQGSKLIGTGYGGSVGQGLSLTLSADGATMIVGTGFVGTQNPPVWIFVKRDGAWLQQGSYLTASNSIITQPGQNTSVAVSADGNAFILGENCDNELTGAAWVFTRSGGLWGQGNKMVAGDAVGHAGFGSSVSISADGTVAVVGGNGDNGDVGAMWVFIGDGSSWKQKGSKLVGTGASGQSLQGNSVALSANGFTALSGGAGDNNMLGATWVFVAAVPASS
jgi:hypothetical protein